jgi:hypothetical protein
MNQTEDLFNHSDGTEKEIDCKELMKFSSF